MYFFKLYFSPMEKSKTEEPDGLSGLRVSCQPQSSGSSSSSSSTSSGPKRKFVPQPQFSGCSTGLNSSIESQQNPVQTSSGASKQQQQQTPVHGTSDDDSGCALEEYTWVPPGVKPDQVRSMDFSYCYNV